MATMDDDTEVGRPLGDPMGGARLVVVTAAVVLVCSCLPGCTLGDSSRVRDERVTRAVAARNDRHTQSARSAGGFSAAVTCEAATAHAERTAHFANVEAALTREADATPVAVPTRVPCNTPAEY